MNSFKVLHPTVSTVGRLNYDNRLCLSRTFELQSFPDRDPAEQVSDPLPPKNDIKRSRRSNSLCSRSFQDTNSLFTKKDLPIESYETENCNFVKKMPQTESTDSRFDMPKSGKPASVKPKTSEMGIQVNIPHCKECKTCVSKRNSYTDCDSDMVDSDGLDIGGGDVLDEYPRDVDSPRSQTHWQKTQHDNVPRKMAVSKVMREICLRVIRLISFAILIWSVVLCVTRIEIIGDVLSEMYYYVRSIKEQQVDEKLSLASQIFYGLFGVREYRFRRLF